MVFAAFCRCSVFKRHLVDFDNALLVYFQHALHTTESIRNHVTDFESSHLHETFRRKNICVIRLCLSCRSLSAHEDEVAFRCADVFLQSNLRDIVHLMPKFKVPHYGLAFACHRSESPYYRRIFCRKFI